MSPDNFRGTNVSPSSHNHLNQIGQLGQINRYNLEGDSEEATGSVKRKYRMFNMLTSQGLMSVKGKR